MDPNAIQFNNSQADGKLYNGCFLYRLRFQFEPLPGLVPAIGFSLDYEEEE